MVEFDGKVFSIESAIFTKVRLPRELVAGVVYELPVGRCNAIGPAADRLLDWAGARADSHKKSAAESAGRIRLLNGDELVGRITGIDEENVRIENRSRTHGRCSASRRPDPRRGRPFC